MPDPCWRPSLSRCQDSRPRRALRWGTSARNSPASTVGAAAPRGLDAVGEGLGLADSLADAYPGVQRFKSGETARAETEYADCWTEALAHLGTHLGSDGVVGDRRLREELPASAGTVEFTETHLSSRGDGGGATVLSAPSKGEVKSALRHGVAWRIINAEQGHTLYDVRNRLRHRSITTTERRYDHVIER